MFIEAEPAKEETEKERVPDASDSSYSSSDETLSQHYADVNSENDPAKSTSASKIVETAESVDEKETEGDEYDAEAEIKMRRAEYLKHCQGRRQSLMRVNYRTG